MRWALWPVVRSVWVAAIAVGLSAFLVLCGLDRLPVLLPAAVHLVAPDLDVTVAGADVDVRGGVVLRDLRVGDRTTGAPLLEADRAALRFSAGGLLVRRLDELRLDGAVVTVPTSLPGGGSDESPASRGWRIGRVVSRGMRVRAPAHGDRPAVSARVELDLRDVGTEPAVANRTQRLVVKDAVVGPPAAPLLRVRAAVIDASAAGVFERRHVDSVRLVRPHLVLGASLPALGGGDGAPGDGGPGWTVGRLVVTGGAVDLAATAERPGATFRVAADLDDLGADPARAARQHQVRLSHLAIARPGGARVLAADDVELRASIAGVRDLRIDEIWVRRPVVTVPREPAPARPTAAPGTPGGAAPAWTVGRLVSDDGRIDVEESGTLPAIAGAFRLDLRELGLDSAHAATTHRIHVRDLRVRYGGQAPSVTIDAGSIDATLAGLLEDRRITRLDVSRGVIVLDRTFRERLAAPGEGAGGSTGWTIDVVDIEELGLRVADLGARIPDVTLLVHTRLTHVPLGGVALATSRQPQRIELANIALNSPLDPFRPVVQVSSLFIDFTLAGLLERQIAAMTILGPTIYLGEDLVWFKDAAGRGEAAGDAGAPWTVRQLRVELGRIVVTYDGLDRATVPLGFRTDAQNVVLGQLATLRLAAALEVPRQDYRFPGLDLDLLGVHGELRFDYPPGSRSDNVVNTLEVDTIRWRDYRITGGWLSATFDEQGVNSTLGGGAYDGYVNGGLSVPYGAGTMAGWAAATDLDLQPIAATVARGGSFDMTGMVNLEASVEAAGTRVDRASADLRFTQPGVLRVPALDSLVSNLPASAPDWQRDLLRAAVQAFADYPYDSGGGTVRYLSPRGEADLELRSQRGKRRIEVNYFRDAPLVAGAPHEGQ